MTNILAANFFENRCLFVSGAERGTKPPYETVMLDLRVFRAGREGFFRSILSKNAWSRPNIVGSIQLAQHSEPNELSFLPSLLVKNDNQTRRFRDGVVFVSVPGTKVHRISKKLACICFYCMATDVCVLAPKHLSTFMNHVTNLNLNICKDVKSSSWFRFKMEPLMESSL